MRVDAYLDRIRYDGPATPTPEVLRKAARAGYELVFTGAPELTPTRLIPFTVGRLPITPGVLSDESGRFRPERLALHLFRRPHLQAWA